MDNPRTDRSTTEHNVRLRIGAGILTAALLVTSANRYMELGWFGSYGRLVSSLTNMAVIFYLIFALRAWRN